MFHMQTQIEHSPLKEVLGLLDGAGLYLRVCTELNHDHKDFSVTSQFKHLISLSAF